MSDIKIENTEQNMKVHEEEKVDTSAQLLQEIKSLKKEIKDIKDNKFSLSEIQQIAKQKKFDDEVQREVEHLEYQRFRENSEKSKTALEMRNQIGDHYLQEFMDGNIAPSQFRQVGKDKDFTNLLFACVFRYLAPKYGISEQHLNQMSLLQMEKEISRNNNPASLIKKFIK